MIDWARVAVLRDEIGEDDFSVVTDLFLEEVETGIGALSAATEPEQLEALLHSLKGSASNLGFCEFSDLCRQGERMAAAGSIETIDIRKIIAAYRASRSEFVSVLGL